MKRKIIMLALMIKMMIEVILKNILHFGVEFRKKLNADIIPMIEIKD